MTASADLLFSRRTLLRVSAAAGAMGTAFPSIAAPVLSRPERLQADLRGQAFDAGWRFFKGNGRGLAARSFDDAGWRILDLPHDWSIEDLPGSDPALNGVIRDADTAPFWQKPARSPRLIGPFDARLNDNQAYAHSASGAPTAFTVGGIGWYRKHFNLPPLAPDAHVELEFDGVYMNAQVWLNGKLVAEHPHGYSAFVVDLTPHLDPSGQNVLAVRVANIGRNSRWYSGSGIYRHVRLNILRAVRFEQWGLTVTTPVITADAATVQVVARTANATPQSTMTTRIRDAAGKVVAEGSGPVDAPAQLRVDRPHLWSPESPALYEVECLLIVGGRTVDRMTAPLGIRTIEIDAVKGLRINGKPHKLRGGCVHHDNGLLGAVAIDRAEERKVELLKARGFNAVRSSHNPSSPAFLAACDRLGMLVMEEAFDMWRVAKNPDDYSLYFDGWWRQDLTAMVRSSANHPSIFMWSIGNEIPERGDPDGVSTAKILAEETRRLDPTRPVTQAVPGSAGPEVTGPDGRPDQAAFQYLDVAGYNYKFSSYERDHAKFPDRVMVGTESFPQDVDKVWRLTEKSPYLIGDFVWTAMDYLGEAGIGRTGLTGDRLGEAEYPWFGAGCGDIDLIGQQRPQSLARDVVWGLSPLEIAVQRPLPEGKKEAPFLWGWRDELQSWTWPGAEGKTLSVAVFSRAERFTIELNGRTVADQLVEANKGAITRVDVPYEPGTLQVTAYAAGRQIGRRKLETVSQPVALRLKADRKRITADRNELAYVTIEILDKAGRLAPDAVHVIRASISGPAELVAFGNANPRGVASFRQPVAKTWHGCALAVLRPTGETGVVTISIEGEGLTKGQAALMVGAVGQRKTRG
ncbi:Beta-galactosidase/beta-glucuronidase [Sphingobium herbicidovorans NBRC 16415]|uniref:Beta-galactosidase/beta-glucuronidase n=1 Tax=Sphingobium herbicidovorans (strain ATCC 700291 / DSM 11019 / CCUG 56400 / KCTC 2939 / LMG 18315 / NBRC 16415 / MH) TaxID=1219045 RepID=A0A086PEL0_SPHHM|nr:glycoside hydrolase family 2 TIM barrel-domain containing protein [Sphingobium herbicidovorans]KFG91828.1 Beta-galactosidase/beta-glucuronidase [Sphingobium herbicidovorans NBRC 16415]